jgi:hypothetical protein
MSNHSSNEQLPSEYTTPIFGSRLRRERSRDPNPRDGRHGTGGRDFESNFGRVYERVRYDPPAVDVDGGSGAGRAILGSQYVAGLPLRRPSQLPSDRQTCGTCLEDYADDQDGAAIVQLPCCQNSIHRECILVWVGESKANNNTCPFCRHKLFTRLHYNGRGLDLDDLQDMLPADNLADFDSNYHIEDMDIAMNHLHFHPQSLDISIHDAGFDDHRLRLADHRRQGALKDRRLYQQLLAGGARLAGNLPLDTHVLNLEQDRAMFEELRRQGAFTQPGMDAAYRAVGLRFTDTAIYEEQRNRGRWWNPEIRRWRDKDGRPVDHLIDIG